MLLLNSHAWELGKSFTPSSLSFTQFSSMLVSTWLCIKRIMAAYGASPSSLLSSLHECWWGARIFNYGFALPCMASCFIWSDRRTSASSRLCRTFKKLMALFWAINTTASCSHVHVFNLLLIRFKLKQACANEPVYHCTYKQGTYAIFFHCMGRCSFWIEQMELKPSINRDRCLFHVVYRKVLSIKHLTWLVVIDVFFIASCNCCCTSFLMRRFNYYIEGISHKELCLNAGLGNTCSHANLYKNFQIKKMEY